MAQDRPVEERIERRLRDPKVARDVQTLADFTRIWCVGRHKGSERHPVSTTAARLGVYGRRIPSLCSECEAHLAYAEKRRACCPKDPKPFCARCDTHCYRPDEREWQRQMMRYSGPRSVLCGHAIDAIRHAAAARRHRAARRAGRSREEGR
ncbi:MAG: nitrous oxide-stimulated promoter family protein [Coriobacteriia bacterium]|nr:nitrous oxide-stimulated promoter family protein [Coriobacteriia bacterium]